MPRPSGMPMTPTTNTTIDIDAIEQLIYDGEDGDDIINGGAGDDMLIFDQLDQVHASTLGSLEDIPDISLTYIRGMVLRYSISFEITKFDL